MLSVGCASSIYNTGNSAPKKDRSYNEVLYDSLSVALEQLELEAEKLKPTRQRCNALFDDYNNSTKYTAPRIVDSMQKATANALMVHRNINERALEAFEITQLLRIYRYKLGTLNRATELIKLRLDTAERNSQHCSKYLQAIEEDYTNRKN